MIFSENRYPLFGIMLYGGRIAMNKHSAHSLRVWLAVLCAIAVVVVLVMADPHLLAESTRVARPFGGVALRSLVWIVIALAAYSALVRQPLAASRALASGRASSRSRR
jgi:uncharacterized membrane protein